MATRDTEVGGTKILKGMVVRPSPQAANYDPDVFPDPAAFRHPSQSEAHSRLRRGAAPLHWQYPRPDRYHDRDPPLGGAISLMPGSLIRISFRSMAALSANCAFSICQ